MVSVTTLLDKDQGKIYNVEKGAVYGNPLPSNPNSLKYCK